MPDVANLVQLRFTPEQAAEIASQGGWCDVDDQLTLSTTTNPTTYVMNCANASSKYQVGDKIRLNHNAVKFSSDISNALWTAYCSQKNSATQFITTTSGGGAIMQDLTQPLPAGTYTLTWDIKVASGTNDSIRIRVCNATDGWRQYTCPLVTTSWQTFSMTFTHSGGALQVSVVDWHAAPYVAVDLQNCTLIGTKYFYVVGATSTTVTLCAGSDYFIDSSSSISSLAYSRLESPWGFPDWFSWVPTWTGFATSPVGVYLFSIKGRSCKILMYTSTSGVAGGSSAGYCKMVLPVYMKNITGFALRCEGIVANHNNVVSPGRVEIVPVWGLGLAFFGCDLSSALDTWNQTGNKNVNGGFEYPI